MLERIRHVAKHFSVADDGAVAAIFGLTLISIVGMIGAAIDYSRTNQVQAKLQGSLDAALLAGARDGSENWVNTALNTFNANAQVQGATVRTPTFQLDANRAYTGTVSAAVPTT